MINRCSQRSATFGPLKTKRTRSFVRLVQPPSPKQRRVQPKTPKQSPPSPNPLELFYVYLCKLNREKYMVLAIQSNLVNRVDPILNSGFYDNEFDEDLCFSFGVSPSSHHALSRSSRPSSRSNQGIRRRQDFGNTSSKYHYLIEYWDFRKTSSYHLIEFSR